MESVASAGTSSSSSSPPPWQSVLSSCCQFLLRAFEPDDDRENSLNDAANDFDYGNTSSDDHRHNRYQPLQRYSDEDAESAPAFYLRRLQSSSNNHSRGRMILTMLYLCVLGVCFAVPLFYYIRLKCDDRRNRRLRDAELAGIAAAMERSQQNREENRAARRKYREERRARIIQLFDPVRMILREEHFPKDVLSKRDSSVKEAYCSQSEAEELDVESIDRSSRAQEPVVTMQDVCVREQRVQDDSHDEERHGIDGNTENKTTHRNKDEVSSSNNAEGIVDYETGHVVESGTADSVKDGDETRTSAGENEQSNGNNPDENADDDNDDDDHNRDDSDKGSDERNDKPVTESVPPVAQSAPEIPTAPAATTQPTSEGRRPIIIEPEVFIEIPQPGLTMDKESERKKRLVSATCSICLCDYEVGSDIVWSSNSACEHVFHTTCIEQWIMKQREGLMCPCCRRDFIIDPYDLEEDEMEEARMMELLSAPVTVPHMTYNRSESDPTDLPSVSRTATTTHMGSTRPITLTLLHRDSWRQSNIVADVSDDSVERSGGD